MAKRAALAYYKNRNPVKFRQPKILDSETVKFLGKKGRIVDAIFFAKDDFAKVPADIHFIFDPEQLELYSKLKIAQEFLEQLPIDKRINRCEFGAGEESAMFSAIHFKSGYPTPGFGNDCIGHHVPVCEFPEDGLATAMPDQLEPPMHPADYLHCNALAIATEQNEFMEQGQSAMQTNVDENVPIVDLNDETFIDLHNQRQNENKFNHKLDTILTLLEKI